MLNVCFEQNHINLQSLKHVKKCPRLLVYLRLYQLTFKDGFTKHDSVTLFTSAWANFPIITFTRIEPIQLAIV